jgi:hypothetical protein
MTDNDTINASTWIVLPDNEFAALGGGHIAYVREIDPEKATSMIGKPVSVEPGTHIFAVYGADGQPLAITDSHAAAVANAVEHELMPMSVH